MLFIASQAVSEGTSAGLRATLGVVLGYVVHSLMVVVGLAATVASFPMLFALIRWIGIFYLLFLAFKLIRSALQPHGIAACDQRRRNQLMSGFLTSLLNPKGMLIYVAVLPQFIDQKGDVTLQAITLSAAFIFWCGVVYLILSITFSRLGGRSLSERGKRLADGAAGGLILLAAGFMAAAHG
ncbi:LysE family translocator [Rhizobium sp. TRM95001]|nr:LysE family translocator [Rhizobium halophilum]MCF6370817.1 LysE family translocator [Rhizobium halophilum]